LGEIPVATVQRVVTVALAVILFDGGMHIGWRRFRQAAGPVIWVGVAGAFLTAGALAILAHGQLGLACWSAHGPSRFTATSHDCRSTGIGARGAMTRYRSQCPQVAVAERLGSPWRCTLQPEMSRSICRLHVRKLISIVRQPMLIATTRCYLIQMLW
jgi:hypothetical protein